MLSYEAPLQDIEFLLFDLFDTRQEWADIPAFEDFSDDLVRAVVAEGGRLASEVLAPLNQSGDAEGCTWVDGVVSSPRGFAEAFKALAEGGWLGLSGNPDYQGQGMPKLMGCLLEEMFWATNPALYLSGTLTVGATICIDAHGTERQKQTYLPAMYSGTWTGAMALTESQAGTDLGIMRTKAQPQADGTYAITGSKIFITSGEHDLAENIIHLVLARLPDAPGGTRGISLFIVPKFLVNDDGSLGQRNAWSSGSIEHKMGIHGSPTNVINYDGATGFLIGAENAGLACMFTMMNYERLSVGLQGLGAGEMAFQQALRYAAERRQGRAPSGPIDGAAVADTLLVHPDVRRMLLTIRAYTEGGRALAMFVGRQLDRGKYQQDSDAQALSELLTPIAKAFFTDRGLDCAVLAQQVLGGHGYVQEWGVEQLVRDARIGQIYEGTNGVQALDLISRKVLKDGGATLRRMTALMRERLAGDRNVQYLQPTQQAAVLANVERLERVTASLLERCPNDPNLAGAVSVEYLELAGLVLYAWLWARMAAAAHAEAQSNASATFREAKRQTAAFFFDRLLPRTIALEASISADSDSLMAPALEQAL
ncbi:MAG: acyl-CoA dehydrogenase C-terminal domain-containing protein [Pseudomonadales bacterium]